MLTSCQSISETSCWSRKYPRIVVPPLRFGGFQPMVILSFPQFSRAKPRGGDGQAEHKRTEIKAQLWVGMELTSSLSLFFMKEAGTTTGYLQMACLTMMASDSGELSPTPASLTAFTQKIYSLPVLSPGTVNLKEKINNEKSPQYYYSLGPYGTIQGQKVNILTSLRTGYAWLFPWGICSRHFERCLLEFHASQPGTYRPYFRKGAWHMGEGA